MTTGLPLQLRELNLSPRQKFTQNTDGANWYWPQIFFWTEGLMLMNQIEEPVLNRISTFDTKDHDEILGRVQFPAQFLGDFPWLAKFTPCASCRILPDKVRADVIACRPSHDPVPVVTGSVRKALIRVPASAKIRLIEEKFVLNEAAKTKSVKRYQLPQFIFEAAKQNNVRFFIRLGKVLQSSERKFRMWTGHGVTRSLASSLRIGVNGVRTTDHLPALCFFSDQALADFCSAIFWQETWQPVHLTQFDNGGGSLALKRPVAQILIIKPVCKGTKFCLLENDG